MPIFVESYLIVPNLVDFIKIGRLCRFSLILLISIENIDFTEIGRFCRFTLISLISIKNADFCRNSFHLIVPNLVDFFD